jgi:hypothetical protein
MLLISRFLTSFRKKFVQNAFEASALPHNVSPDALQSHLSAQNPDGAVIVGHREAVSDLEAKFLSDCRGQHNPATFT